MVISSVGHKKGKLVGNVIIILVLLSGIFFIQPFFQAASSVHNGVWLVETLQDGGVTIEKVVLQQNSVVSNNQTKEDFLMMKKEYEELFGLHLRESAGTSQKNLYTFEGEKALSPTATLQAAWIGQEEAAESANLHSQMMLQIILDEPTGWEEYDRWLTEMLAEVGITPDIRPSFQGYLSDSLTLEGQTVLIEQMLAQLDAQVVEGIVSDELVSLSGFSNKLKGSIQTTSGKLNVQIAARVNQSSLTTQITIGHPIIGIAY